MITVSSIVCAQPVIQPFPLKAGKSHKAVMEKEQMERVLKI